MLTDSDFAALHHHMEVENKHLLEETLATLAEDVAFDDKALGLQPKGRAEVGEYYRMWWEALDVTVEVEQVYPVAGRRLVVVETVWKGTHVGPFLGAEATGKAVSLPIVIVARVEDGLLAEERFYWDRLRLLDQLSA